MSDTGDPAAGRGLPMRVDNLGFFIDKMGRDAGPLQFLREITHNSIQAIEGLPERKGEIAWDVDWNRYVLTDGRAIKAACIDTGIGMTGPEQIELINAFAASIHEQAFHKNYGIGAKIAAATRNHEGLVYLSWKDGKGAMTHLWRNPDSEQYEMRPFTLPDGRVQHWLPISSEIKPEPIQDHGTMVVLLGGSEYDDTMASPAQAPSPSRWIARHLNTRYFRFPDGINVRAREGWTFPRSDKDRNLLRRVTGQEAYLLQHSSEHGTVELEARETGCRARAHWYVLKDEPALDQNSGYIASSGHMAALYQDELYEMVNGRAGVARLQLFGVLFGYKRVVIYVEPLGDRDDDVLPDTPRQRLLFKDERLPWEDWAAEFRAKFPDAITALMEEVTKDSESESSTDAIRERLKRIRDLLRFPRYRRSPSGDLRAVEETVGGNAKADGREQTGSHRGGGRGGRSGDLYTLWADPDGVPVEQVTVDNMPDTVWVTVANGRRTPPAMEDRAAKYLAEQNLLQINGDFRGFTDMVDRWLRFYGNKPGTKPVIEHAVREWFEQALVETVLGVQALQGSPEWTPDDMAKALSEEALTSAVMQRYHVDNAVKRALGSKLGPLQDRAA